MSSARLPPHVLREAGTLRPYPLKSLSGLGGAAVRSGSDCGEVSHLLRQDQGLSVRVQTFLVSTNDPCFKTLTSPHAAY